MSTSPSVNKSVWLPSYLSTCGCILNVCLLADLSTVLLVYLSVCLLVLLSKRLPAYLLVCLFEWLSTCMSVCLHAVCLPVCIPACLCTCVSVYCCLPACLSTCPSVYIPVFKLACMCLPACLPTRWFFLPAGLFAFLSVYLPVRKLACLLTAYLPVHQLVLSTCLSVYLLFCKHAYLLSTCLSVTHGFFLPVYLSTCPSVSLPVYCLHACTYVSQPAWSFCLRVCRLCINLIFIFSNSVFTTKSVITYFYKLDLTYVSWKL